MKKKLICEEAEGDNMKRRKIELKMIKMNGEDQYRVGVRCQKDCENCYDLAKEILKILENIGFEWKITSPNYTISCREKKNENEKTSNKGEIPLLVSIKILGGIEKDDKSQFLVDLHRAEGSIMEFLTFSSNFISSAQQSGILLIK